MLIIVAPDKFKGSMTAARVAAVVAEELRTARPDCSVLELPIADGGEGTVDLALSSGMKRVEVVVAGPLGHPVSATYACSESTAVIEMAAAAGLDRLPLTPDRVTAVTASTGGVGQMIADAVNRGVDRVILGLGGSATTDGGAGLAVALGATVLTSRGARTPPGGAGLEWAATVDLEPMVRRLGGVEIVVATDVDNPLTGPDGAAVGYGHQKGADEETICRLDRNLAHWADLLHRTTGVDARNLAGAGAAGGTALPLLAAGCARIESGIAVMMALTEFSSRIRGADLVIVGEGSLDRQSLRGKGPVGAARLAGSNGAAVLAIVGTNKLSAAELDEAAIGRVYALTDVEPDLEICMRDPEPILRAVASRIAAEPTLGVE